MAVPVSQDRHVSQGSKLFLWDSKSGETAYSLGSDAKKDLGDFAIFKGKF